MLVTSGVLRHPCQSTEYRFPSSRKFSHLCSSLVLASRAFGVPSCSDCRPCPVYTSISLLRRLIGPVFCSPVRQQLLLLDLTFDFPSFGKYASRGAARCLQYRTPDSSISIRVEEPCFTVQVSLGSESGKLFRLLRVLPGLPRPMTPTAARALHSTSTQRLRSAVC